MKYIIEDNIDFFKEINNCENKIKDIDYDICH